MFSPAFAQEEKTENETPSVQPAPLAKTALRDLRLSALADPNSIAVQWRYVSNGETIKIAPVLEDPDIEISGLKTSNTRFVKYADQNVETIIVLVVAGKSAREAEYFFETAKSAARALPDGSYRVLVGTGGQSFAWASDVKLVTDGGADDWDEAFGSSEPAFASAVPKTATLVRAFADSMAVLKQASPQSRVALLAPESIFPENSDLLKQLTEAAYAQRISFFPMAPPGGVNPPRAQQMNDIAGPTAGRFLPDALTGRTPEQKRALFNEFVSGNSAIFEIAHHYRYALPKEKIKPVELTINYGELTDTLTLAHDRPVLKGGALVKAFLNPAHWGNWLVDGARWPYGLGALILWLAVIAGVFRLLVPSVKVFVQIAGETGIQKIRRLPAQIGRGSHAVINLDNDGVSREHAEIRKDGRGMVLVDLGSSNGTWIGGERVKSASLSKVQTVQIGPVRLILRPRNVRAPIKGRPANSHE